MFEKFALDSDGNRLHQMRWSATDLKAFRDCPYRYYLSKILDLNPESTGMEPVHFAFGTAWHSCMEIYDKAKAMGRNSQQALQLALLQSEKFSGMDLHEDTKRNLANLQRALVWYVDQWGEDELSTIILDQPAVEWEFTLPIDGTGYSYKGIVDRLATDGKRNYIIERKTTALTIDDFFFERYMIDGQFDGYQLNIPNMGIPIDGIIIEAHQIAVGFSRFIRCPLWRTPTQLREWLDDTRMTLRMFEVFNHHGHFPKNDRSCKECQFREECRLPPERRFQ